MKASDLQKAQARQQQKAVEINPKKTLEVSIVKKANVPTVSPIGYGPIYEGKVRGRRDSLRQTD